MNKLILLTGPTCSGKTRHGVQLARALGGEVVNFDSLLFYRELNIGTAKPSLGEREGVPHHMIDVCSARDPMNAHDFARAARPMVADIHARGCPVLLVGGSGFYAQALLKGMYDSPTTPDEIKARSEALYAGEGIDPFLAELRRHDPASAARYHPNDHYRVRRAVEHWWAHGTPFSLQREGFVPEAPPWEVLHLHLDLPKEDHLKLIIERTRGMLAAGLEAEVRALLGSGFHGREKPLQAIGYKETVQWIAGGFGTDRAAWEERIVINTRRLAKAQRTWFQKIVSKAYDPRTEGEALRRAGEEFIGRE